VYAFDLPILLPDGLPFLSSGYISILFPITLPCYSFSIPFPLVYTINCCTHSPVGWSAFLPLDLFPNLR
jgi:hypothetical protein